MLIVSRLIEGLLLLLKKSHEENIVTNIVRKITLDLWISYGSIEEVWSHRKEEEKYLCPSIIPLHLVKRHFIFYNRTLKNNMVQNAQNDVI